MQTNIIISVIIIEVVVNIIIPRRNGEW